jgi:outer membrane protein
MRSISTWPILTLSLLLFVAVGARAETLHQALRDTWHNNPNLAAARAQQSAAEHDVRAARGGWYPKLGLSGQLARDHTSGRITLLNPPEDFSDNLNQASISLRLDQPIWEGGRLSSKISAAENASSASRAQTRASSSQVFLNAVKAYLNVVAAQKLLQVQKDNVKVIGRRKQAAKDALNHGEGTKTDVAQADSRLQAAVAQRIRAASKLAQMRALYRTVIGHDPRTLELPTKLPTMPATLMQAEHMASGNYRVKAAQFKAHSATAKADAAANAVMPKIGAFAEVRREREPQFGFQKLNDTMVGIRLSVPIWRGGSVRAKSAAARDKAHAAQLKATAASDSARREVVTAWHDYAATESSLVAIKSQLSAARTAYDGVKALHRHGERTLLDVLNAEQEVRNAEASKIQARRDRIVAAYTLEAAMGRLNREALGLAPVNNDSSKP